MGFILSKQDNMDEKTIHFNLATSKDLLLIFTRNPELGKCKTRLAATIGDKSALEIYKFLLEHTVTITRNLNVKKQVCYSEEIWKDDIWNASFFDKKVQKGGSLGERMANAFLEGFEAGFEKICIIGSDMHDLEQDDLEEAFSSLNQQDFVIGPASDGGYYLLGMKSFSPDLFKNKDWGSETVLKNTLIDLKNEKVHVLETRNDIDRYEDIKDVPAFQSFLKTL